MRQAMAIFLIAFLVFGTLGFIAARDQVSKPEDIKEWAFRPVELRIDKTGTRYSLEYKHHDQVIYHFDVDSNHLEKTEAGERLELEVRSQDIS